MHSIIENSIIIFFKHNIRVLTKTWVPKYWAGTRVTGIETGNSSDHSLLPGVSSVLTVDSDCGVVESATQMTAL